MGLTRFARHCHSEQSEESPTNIGNSIKETITRDPSLFGLRMTYNAIYICEKFLESYP